jgi:protein Tex
VETLADLKPDMSLEGPVTNVANFGAFVDIGVHQDGLVHIAQLPEQFVKYPHTVVKASDLVKVKVLAVDLPRKRIALTIPSGPVPRGPRPWPPPTGQTASPGGSGSPSCAGSGSRVWPRPGGA